MHDCIYLVLSHSKWAAAPGHDSRIPGPAFMGCAYTFDFSLAYSTVPSALAWKMTALLINLDRYILLLLLIELKDYHYYFKYYYYYLKASKDSLGFKSSY
jgi:hypothetical protein